MTQVSLAEMADDIMAQMPPATRFNDEDARILYNYRRVLLGFEPTLIQGFYNTVYAHDATKAIFKPGERPAREDTLRKWWNETTQKKIGKKYWEWQVLVGLIHIKRKVKNPMMIGMWGFLLTALNDYLQSKLSAREAQKVMNSFKRLAATTQSLTAESYLENYLIAIGEATGFSANLLDVYVQMQIDDLLRAAGR